MEGLAIGLSTVAVGLFLLGLYWGLRQGRSVVQIQLDEAKNELKDLRSKAVELAAAKEREKAQEEKYAQMRADLDKAFADLAGKALRDNNESFLSLARQKLGAQSEEAKQALAQKEEAIKKLIDPLDKALKSLDEQTRAMEKERSGAYSQVKTLVEEMQKSIPASLDALKYETSQLITALRAPKTRGNWGELQLKRCVEFAGMVAHCSFAEQTSTRAEDDRLLRPDMAIQLPNGRTIIVDAKTPLDAFLEASQSGDPGAQAVQFATHAERVKSHLRELSSKAYWKQFDRTPEFVVCFLPSEALFSAALEADPSLIEFGSQANVVMATPTTLIALLKAVAYGWKQSEVAQSAKAIQEAGRDLYGKLVNAHEYFEKMGSALASAVGQYNKFVGAVEGRGGAFSQARKLGELMHDSSTLEPLEATAIEPRMLSADDWPEPGIAIAAKADQNVQIELNQAGLKG